VAYDAIAGDWEAGIGTVASGSPNTLARTVVLASSNSGSLVNFLTAPVISNQPAAQLYNSLIGATPGELLVSQANAAPAYAPFLFADTTNHRLGIGTNTPTVPLSVNGTSQPLLPTVGP